MLIIHPEERVLPIAYTVFNFTSQITSHPMQLPPPLRIVINSSNISDIPAFETVDRDSINPNRVNRVMANIPNMPRHCYFVPIFAFYNIQTPYFFG